MPDQLKVLFLSPEVVPFAKTGGLADVAGALPEALKRLGLDVRLVLPYYQVVREDGFETRPTIKGLKIPLGHASLPADILETQNEDGVPIYLIQREDLYDRPNLYGTSSGDYYDNLERFSFFAHASLRTADALGFKPDAIHCHDWQTGLVPALIKGPYRDNAALGGTPCIFTIHNLGYQGVFPSEKLAMTGLSSADYFRPDGLEYWGNISLLKAGIVYSDAITTVSPTYAKEIQTPEFGHGMEGILYHRRALLRGILNGADYRLWNPAHDPHIPAQYSGKQMGGKAKCKASLIDELGLAPSLSQRPVLGMVSRLDRQKGLDLLVDMLDHILSQDLGLVILGSGDEEIQGALERAAGRYPGRLALTIGFDEPLAHRIMAGADIFLIPSRYEPCGLTQMYGLKYGTVPVVRATGGLDDTIEAFDPQTGRGNGFKFSPYVADAFLAAIRQAITFFDDPKIWKKLIANAMGADFSWDRAAKAYLELYRSLLKK